MRLSRTNFKSPNFVFIFRVSDKVNSMQILSKFALNVYVIFLKINLRISLFYFFLAEWLRQCKQSNPTENDCFREMFEGMFPMLARGKWFLVFQRFQISINAFSNTCLEFLYHGSRLHKYWKKKKNWSPFNMKSNSYSVRSLPSKFIRIHIKSSLLLPIPLNFFYFIQNRYTRTGNWAFWAISFEFCARLSR